MTAGTNLPTAFSKKQLPRKTNEGMRNLFLEGRFASAISCGWPCTGMEDFGVPPLPFIITPPLVAWY
jgi:hypothetical protein